VPRPPSPAAVEVHHERVTLDKPFPADVTSAVRRSSLPGADPCIRVAHDGTWRTSRTPEGPATVRVVDRPAEVVADAWGPGAGWMAERLATMAGLHDDRAGFDPSTVPFVAELARRRPAFRIGRSDRLVEALIPTILGQRVAAVEAARSYRALVRVFGGPAPGPADLPLPPDPARLARLTAFQLHRFGVESHRAATIIATCRRAASVDRLTDRPVAEAASALATLRGIGPWTITTVRGLVWGDPDAAVVGDYNLPHAVAWVMAGEARASDERMLELLAPFPGHRGRVQQLVVRHGGPPRRAPRARLLPLSRL